MAPSKERSILLSRDVAFFHPHDAGEGTVVGMAGGAKAPEDTIGLARVVDRSVTFRAMTATATTAGFPAAVIIGDQVVATVAWIVAGANPGHRRSL